MTLYLAFEGGGTTTRAALYDAQRAVLSEDSGAASNPVDIGVDGCAGVLVSLARALLGGRSESLCAVAAGIAGAANPETRGALARRIGSALRAERTYITDDLRPLLLANAPDTPALLAIAGTGSSVLAQAASGEMALIGGRGPLFGDEGSAYQIAVSSIRAAAHAIDGTAPPTQLADALPKVAGVSSFAEFAVWARGLTKRELANLAIVVTRLAADGDEAAWNCVTYQAERLAAQVVAARARLSLPPDTPVFLNGGLFEHCAQFRAAFETSLAALEPGLRPSFPDLRGPRAVLELCWLKTVPTCVSSVESGAQVDDGLPPTEQQLAVEHALDCLTARGIVDRMNTEDARTISAVAAAAFHIAEVIEFAKDAIQSGGRIIYIGAGTSGRLGVLDASECPPTFGVSSSRVIGIIAGGARALRESVEGAEDNIEQATADLEELDPPVSSYDAVIGIAASGGTPYVRAALDAAGRLGARTALICCNPSCRDAAAVVVALDTGPEVLPGSTRLKAGTATKMVLNMITTGALALSGYVYEGQMVGMRPINAKLRRRAVRIIAGLTGVSEARAEESLASADDSIPIAVIMMRLGLDAMAAKNRLAAAGSLRAALKDSQ